MGSPGSGAADCSVGSIVWVRRRNGSWWPGKILGQEDLDSTHITSPRSGTPVKLLGREDASVDWYNLEKSKRVKPFRCGDFDECIERVESTQGLTIRKREKYARREDAILHALELEKEMLKKEGKLLVPEKARDIANGTRESGDCLVLNHIGDDDDVMGLQKDKEEEEEDHPSCEDEAVPRMRGLQDFGLRTAASSKRKFSSFNGPDNTSFKSLARSNSPASSSGDHSMDRPIYTLGKENARSTMEAKRTKYMFTPNASNDVSDLHESLLSHREALRSSSFPGAGRGGDPRYSLVEYDPPEFLEDVEESESEESETETSDMEEDTDDDIPLLSGSTRHTEQRNTFSRHMSGEDESTSSEEEEEEDHYESSMSGDSSYLNEAGTVSKWQLKGKRNMRNLPRRSTRKREMHHRSSNRLEDGRYCEYKRRGFSQFDFNNGINDMSDDGTEDTDPRFGDDDDDDYRIPNMITSRCNKNIFSHEMLDWDDDPWEGRFGNSTKKRWEEEKIEGFGRKTYSPLVDVDLEVRGSYQKGPVPIVSLMSKLNGRAIIGHPVEVEVLPDGYDYFGNETTYNDKPFLLPPAWKTARRSNSRVPRSHPFSSSSLEADDHYDHHHSPVRKPVVKKLGLGNLMRIPRPPGERKQQYQHQHQLPPQKKFVKNANATASQKTRALSSFSSEQGGGHNSSGMKALNRTHEQLSSSNSRRVLLPGPPTVACIPVKLVFSRLLEKINRPPSKPTTAKAFNERRRDHQ